MRRRVFSPPPATKPAAAAPSSAAAPFPSPDTTEGATAQFVRGVYPGQDTSLGADSADGVVATPIAPDDGGQTGNPVEPVPPGEPSGGAPTDTLVVEPEAAKPVGTMGTVGSLQQAQLIPVGAAWKKMWVAGSMDPRLARKYMMIQNQDPAIILFIRWGGQGPGNQGYAIGAGGFREFVGDGFVPWDELWGIAPGAAGPIAVWVEVGV